LRPTCGQLYQAERPVAKRERKKYYTGELTFLVFWLLTIPSVVSAQGVPFDDPNATWAWSKIQKDEIANFNDICPLNPHQEEIGWVDPCRRIPHDFLKKLLGDPTYRDQLPQHGTRLVGAYIDGTVDLTDMKIEPEVWIKNSRVDGDLVLTDSRWKLPLVLSNSVIVITFSARRMHSSGIVQCEKCTFNHNFDLRNAKLDHNLGLSYSLFMGKTTIRNAQIGGDLDLIGSTISDAFDANKVTVAGNLFMRDGAKFNGEVDLRRANVRNNLELAGSLFRKAVEGNGLAVTGNLYMNENAAFLKNVNLVRVTVGGVIDLRDATATQIDISGSSAGELNLEKLGWACGAGAKVQWRLQSSDWRNAKCEELPVLALRNFRAGAFQDSSLSWPPRVYLEGFRYERLGGAADVAANDMRNRPPSEWTDWLARDQPFSSQPYAQLSSVLAAAGQRDTADAISFAGRDRERDDVCTTWTRLESCLWLTFLSYVAGYGIGLYTFRVLWWVILFALLGVVVLHFSQTARAHSIVWRFGASLHRLLPIITLSKEFDDFFDNSDGDCHNLNRFQVGYFAVHAIAGWVLGLILLAAMSGLTQKG
jgi:hypothetical protein